MATSLSADRYNSVRLEIYVELVGQSSAIVLSPCFTGIIIVASTV